MTLQHFSSFAFGRFGRWIDRSQSSHSEAVDFSMFAFHWIGIGELRQGQRVGGSPGSFTCLFFGFGRQLVSLRCSDCSDPDLLVWDLQVDGVETNPRRLPGHSNWVRSVAFSPDGRFLASADGNGKVLVWCTKVNSFFK